MKLLPKFFLVILLLTVESASWAACPEGTKNNYKGECVPAADEGNKETEKKTTRAVQEDWPQFLQRGVNSAWFRAIFDLNNPQELNDLDLEIIREAGFGHIRLHLHFEGLAFVEDCVPKGWWTPEDESRRCLINAYKKHSKKGFNDILQSRSELVSNRVWQKYQEAVKRITDAGLVVMVTPNDFFQDPSKRPLKLMHYYLEKDKNFRHLYLRFWNFMTQELAQYSEDQVFFQSVNEPRFCPWSDQLNRHTPRLNAWFPYERKILETMRKNLPRHYFVSSAVCTNGNQLFAQTGSPDVDVSKVLRVHEDVERVLYSLHLYTPIVFSLQGVSDIHMNRGEIPPIKYPVDPENIKSVKSKIYDRDNRDELVKYATYQWNRSAQERLARSIANWANSNGAQVIITEWGISRTNVSGPNTGPSHESRIAYLRDRREALEQYGIFWTYENYQQWTGLTRDYETDRNSPPGRFPDPNAYDALGMNTDFFNTLYVNCEAADSQEIYPFEDQCKLGDFPLDSASGMTIHLGEAERTDEGFWREVDVTLRNHGSVHFAFDVAFWGSGSRANPNWIALYFKDDALPSIDISKMRECGAKNWMVKEKNGMKRASFPFHERNHLTRCLYNVLDGRDQKVMKEIVEGIETIMAQGTEGEADADYWKKIATIIKDNGTNVIQ